MKSLSWSDYMHILPEVMGARIAHELQKVDATEYDEIIRLSRLRELTTEERKEKSRLIEKVDSRMWRLEKIFSKAVVLKILLKKSKSLGEDTKHLLKNTDLIRLCERYDIDMKEITSTKKIDTMLKKIEKDLKKEERIINPKCLGEILKSYTKMESAK